MAWCEQSWQCGSACMKNDAEALRIMMDIGALLRLNMRDLVNEPMMRQIMLKLLAQQCDG